jgi:hypothetical protein
MELGERAGQVVGGRVPVSIGDAQARMSGLHRTTRINTGSARRAQLLREALAEAGFRVETEPGKKTSKTRIAR